MHRRPALLATALPALLVCGLSADRLPIGAGAPTPPAARSAASATPKDYRGCGPGAIPETGLQGQVPLADQESGRSKRGYRCNLRLLGQADIASRGANFQLGWYKHCAYVSIVGNQFFQAPPGPPRSPLDGVAVIDASNPRKPRVVRVVQSPLGRTQHEAVEVNERRGMLVVETGGLAAQWIEIYDVSQDCTKPVFKGRYDAGVPTYHGLRISDDGNTVYASDFTNLSSLGQAVHMFDVSDMSRPTLLKAWSPGEENPPRAHVVHDLDVSPDGNRAYLGSGLGGGLPVFTGGPPREGGPSLVTLDTSDIQRRRPDPDPKVVSSINLPYFGHTVQRARVGGRPYMIVSGENPSTGSGRCPWAWGHIVDMGDERRPRAVSELKLEVNEEENCENVERDNAVYSIHYIGVDDDRNTSRVFYTYYSGGLRVFDVRNPARPKEIAYYHPSPKPDTIFKPASPFTGDKQTPEWDSVASMVRYRPESGQVWIASIANGFQVLELSGPCLAPRAPIGPRNIGRVRLGYTRSRLLRRLPVAPVRRTRHSQSYCVRGRSGRVAAVFSRGRVELVATTARGHGNRGVGVRARERAFRRAYPNRRRIGRGLFRASRRSPRLFGVRGGRVRFIAVANRRLLARPRALRRALRRAGIRA